MTEIVSVVGARPQFVKAAMVSRALRAAGIHERLIHTGQHYDDNMSSVFFREMDIPFPDVNLGVGSGSHARQTGEIMTRLEKVLQGRRPPESVLVYGDTNSTVAATVTARKLHIPVAHVEAGLRSFNRRMPEEINRIVTDRLSDLLFCPTGTAVQNLMAEGIEQGVELTGDVMYDATLHYSKALDPGITDAPKGAYYLVTIHRPENADNPQRLKRIFQGLERLSETVVFLMHPRMRERIHGLDLPQNVQVRAPQPYLKTLALVKSARRVLTDSGGLQKEAIWVGTPCVTLREETEWIETLAGGWNVLAGADPDAIVQAVRMEPSGPPPSFGMVGNVRASDRIAAALKRF